MQMFYLHFILKDVDKPRVGVEYSDPGTGGAGCREWYWATL